MKFLLRLLASAAAMQSSVTLACSLAVREHSILASRPPAVTGDDRTTIRIAVSEALLPARSAKTQYPFQHTWLGLRGQRLIDGAGEHSADLVEVVGKIDLVCFYPSDAYEVLPDGRLVVWISGKLETSTPMKMLLANGSSPTESAGSVWRQVRWPLDNVENPPALPSNSQPGIIPS